MAKNVGDRKILFLALVVLIIAYAATSFSQPKETAKKYIRAQQQLKLDLEVTPKAINLNVACESSYKPFAKVTGMVFGLDPCETRYD